MVFFVYDAFLVSRMSSVAEMACDGAVRRACQGSLQWGLDVHHGVKATFYLYWAQNKQCPFCRDGRCEFNALAEQYMLQKGEGCNLHSAISSMPCPHGTDLMRSFKCAGCCTHARMPFENGICNQCHTALSITYDDVTIRHLFDAHLPGIVELRYRVLKDWTERCPIHKIAEQVKFRKSTRKYKEQLRWLSWRCRPRDGYIMCLVPSSAFSYASCIYSSCDGSTYHSISSVECDGGVEGGGDVYQADSGDERNGDGERDVESCRYGSSSEVMPNRAVDAESANQDNGCVVCMERPPNRLMWPCKHLCLCAVCVEKATAKGTCPICIRKFTEVVEVFLP